MRKRKIGKWGDSLALLIPKNDAVDLDIEQGDIVDLETLKILEKSSKKKGVKKTKEKKKQ